MTRLDSEAAPCERKDTGNRVQVPAPQSTRADGSISQDSPEGYFWHEALHPVVERPGERNGLADLVHCGHSALINTQAVPTIDGHDTAQPIRSHVSDASPPCREETRRWTWRNRQTFHSIQGRITPGSVPGVAS